MQPSLPASSVSSRIVAVLDAREGGLVVAVGALHPALGVLRLPLPHHVVGVDLAIRDEERGLSSSGPVEGFSHELAGLVVLAEAILGDGLGPHHRLREGQDGVPDLQFEVAGATEHLLGEGLAIGLRALEVRRQHVDDALLDVIAALQPLGLLADEARMHAAALEGGGGIQRALALQRSERLGREGIVEADGEPALTGLCLEVPERIVDRGMGREVELEELAVGQRRIVPHPVSELEHGFEVGVAVLDVVGQHGACGVDRDLRSGDAQRAELVCLGDIGEPTHGSSEVGAIRPETDACHGARLQGCHARHGAHVAGGTGSGVDATRCGPDLGCPVDDLADDRDMPEPSGDGVGGIPSADDVSRLVGGLPESPGCGTKSAQCPEDDARSDEAVGHVHQPVLGDALVGIVEDARLAAGEVLDVLGLEATHGGLLAEVAHGSGGKPWATCADESDEGVHVRLHIAHHGLEGVEPHAVGSTCRLLESQRGRSVDRLRQQVVDEIHGLAGTAHQRPDEGQSADELLRLTDEPLLPRRRVGSGRHVEGSQWPLRHVGRTTGSDVERRAREVHAGVTTLKVEVAGIDALGEGRWAGGRGTTTREGRVGRRRIGARSASVEVISPTHDS